MVMILLHHHHPVTNVFVEVTIIALMVVVASVSHATKDHVEHYEHSRTQQDGAQQPATRRTRMLLLAVLHQDSTRHQ